MNYELWEIQLNLAEFKVPSLKFQVTYLEFLYFLFK